MEPTSRWERRKQILAAYGASPAEIEELLVYNEPIGDRHHTQNLPNLPLTSEPHISAWQEYATAAKEIGVFEVLKQRLTQLCFPIQTGISQTDAYQSATRKGHSVAALSAASGLVLQQPDQLDLLIHKSLAGEIPVLVAKNRADFVSLVQALTLRNEPKPIPDSMGACIVSGFNNWDRVRQYRSQWEAANPDAHTDREWQTEFQHLVSQKELYQDRFIILSQGPYSAVPAADLGLTETDWQHLSFSIRLEHECTHYFTRRILGSMKNNLLDEFIADYRGIVGAIGRYRADWFLRFMGLDSGSEYRASGRFQNYRGTPPLSPGALNILAKLVQAAATKLEYVDTQHRQALQHPHQQARLLMYLTASTLEELATDDGTWLNNAISNIPSCEVPHHAFV